MKNHKYVGSHLDKTNYEPGFYLPSIYHGRSTIAEDPEAATPAQPLKNIVSATPPTKLTEPKPPKSNATAKTIEAYEKKKKVYEDAKKNMVDNQDGLVYKSSTAPWFGRAGPPIDKNGIDRFITAGNKRPQALMKALAEKLGKIVFENG